MIQNKKIFICCTEQSGENIAYNICKKLKKYNYQIDGVGGSLSENFLTNKFFDISIFKSLGFMEIILSIPKFIKIINFLFLQILKNNYDIVILIDSPDFNYHLAKKLKQNKFNKKIIQIVAPTVWAWRKGRAKKFAKIYDELFTLFKFEKQYFEKYGLKTTFIGHPVSQINSNIIKLNKEKKFIAFLFGSRENEINKLYPYFQNIHDDLIKSNINKYELFIPTLPHLKNKIVELTKNWKINILVSDDQKLNESYYNEVFVSVTCSGTASLEISKRMIPQIIIYKLNFITFFLFSFLIKIRFANILNILNNKMIITEVVNNNLNKKKLLAAFNQLISDKSYRENQIKKVKKSFSEIDSNSNPYAICEDRIIKIISKAS
ncbi:hypothetical protein IDH28_02430 [Pelagibacterales bacterium SAG-MED31]|nr:hypothetical protein [Pelagibacterales bacterium SAG-MED31]